MCQTERFKGSGMSGCTCGCCGCGCGPFPRRFFSRGEEMERLKSYRDQLKHELAALTEQLEQCGEK